jgi:hypothetical protein
MEFITEWPIGDTAEPDPPAKRRADDPALFVEGKKAAKLPAPPETVEWPTADVALARWLRRQAPAVHSSTNPHTRIATAAASIQGHRFLERRCAASWTAPDIASVRAMLEATARGRSPAAHYVLATFYDRLGDFANALVYAPALLPWRGRETHRPRHARRAGDGSEAQWLCEKLQRQLNYTRIALEYEGASLPRAGLTATGRLAGATALARSGVERIAGMGCLNHPFIYPSIHRLIYSSID